MSLKETPIFEAMVEKHGFHPDTLKHQDNRGERVAAHEQWLWSAMRKVEAADLTKKTRKRPAKK